MSTIAIIVLGACSVANSFRILGNQHFTAAGNHHQRYKNRQIQHSTTEDESHSLGGKGFFRCSEVWFKIERKNKVIEKYKAHFDLVQSLRQTSEKEAGFPKPINNIHTHLPKPEAEYYWNYQHLHTLATELNEGIRDLKTYVAREMRTPIDLFCFGKNQVIRRQREVVAKYVQIIELNMKIIYVLQRKVIIFQSILIEKRDAILSDIEGKEEQFDIQPQGSGEEQALVEMALRESLGKDIEALESINTNLDNYAPPNKDNCARRKTVIDYQKIVISRYDRLLVVSFARLKERCESDAEIKQMQAALGNLLKADIKKMEISMNLIEPTSMPTSTKLLKPVAYLQD